MLVVLGFNGSVFAQINFGKFYYASPDIGMVQNSAFISQWVSGGPVTYTPCLLLNDYATPLALYLPQDPLESQQEFTVTSALIGSCLNTIDGTQLPQALSTGDISMMHAINIFTIAYDGGSTLSLTTQPTSPYAMIGPKSSLTASCVSPEKSVESVTIDYSTSGKSVSLNDLESGSTCDFTFNPRKKSN